ncbi:MAG: hypothetical protein ACI9OB_000008 [Nonlabens sp.]|jgi:uncharacterized protein YhaN
MRITGLHVDGFGLLHDVDVVDVGPGLTVVLGPNEAGKSTLHAFLTRTLLGHPRAGNAAGRGRHAPLRGGAHGGWITVADDQGGVWEVHRYLGTTRPLRVIRPDGTETGGADAVLELVGASMDLERFEQVYAIDVDALSGLGSLEGDTLHELLFDAATVGTGRSLRGARDEAAARRDALWTPKATKKKLSQALQRRADAATGLFEAQAVSSSYGGQRDARDAAAAQLHELRARQDVARGASTLLRRVQDAWPAWQVLQTDASAQLSDGADGSAAVVVAPDLVRAEADARQTLAAAQTALAERVEQLADLDDQRAAVPDHAASEPWEDDVRRLHDRLGVHEDEVTRLYAARGKADAAQRALDERLAELGAGWDETQLLAVATDAASRELLAVAGDALGDARREVERTGRVAADQVASVNRVLDRLERRQAQHADAPDAEEVRHTEEAVRVLRARLPELERAVSEGFMRGRDRQGAMHRTVVGGVSMVLFGQLAGAIVVASVLAQLLSGSQPGFGSLGLSVLVAAPIGFVLAYLLGGTAGPGDDVPDALDAMAPATLETMRQEIERAAQLLGLDAAPLMLDVERAAEGVAQARAQIVAAAGMARELGDIEQQHGDERARSDDAAAAAGAAVEDLMAAHEQWVAVGEAVGVVAADEPRVTLIEHDRAIDAARAVGLMGRALQDADTLQERVTQLRADVVAVVSLATGDELEPDRALQLLGTLQLQIADREQQRREHARLTGERERQQTRHGVAAAAVVAAIEARAAIWDRVNAVDAASFAAVLAAAEVSATAVRERATASARIDELLGTGEVSEAGRALLAQADPTAWASKIADRTRDIQELDEQRDSVLRAHTALSAEVERLGGDDAVARAQQELESAKAEVATLAEQWAVSDVAARLLQATLERFEREQQPVVLAAASGLLRAATLGAWAEVRRFDDQLVVAREVGGEPVSVDKLSRGTREQLYLSLRLALAEELSDGRRLPLLIDDLLGTTDPDRSAAVARLIADVATRHQVWLFTPTPATAALLTQIDDTAAVLELRRGGAVKGWRAASRASGGTL